MSPGQPPQGQQQAPPSPFTTADNLQSQRLQQAQSAATKARDDGDIDDQGHQALMDIIEQRLKPLMDRKLSGEKQAKEQAEQAKAAEHAQLVAMEQKAAEYRAQSLVERIAHVADPLTGQIASLYESSPNHWEQITFPVAPHEQQAQEVE